MLEADIRYAVREESLHIRLREDLEGRVIGICGPSGSGKTSFLNLLCGLRRPDEGRIVLGGQVLFDSAGGTDLPPHRRGIGVVFQDYRLFPHLTVRQNLNFGRSAAFPPEGYDRLVELLRLGPLLDRKPGRLSGGEKQRTALGRSVLALPRLLLLDEPFSALDPRLREESAGWLRSIAGEYGIPMILVSHSRKELLEIAGLYMEFEGTEILGTKKCLGITA